MFIELVRFASAIDVRCLAIPTNSAVEEEVRDSAKDWMHGHRTCSRGGTLGCMRDVARQNRECGKWLRGRALVNPTLVQ